MNDIDSRRVVSYFAATVALPRQHVRVVRWAECLFAVPVLGMLLSLPFPPSGDDVVPFAVLSAGIVCAGLVWWGMRSPTRLTYWAAFVLAGAWGLSFGPRCGVWLRMIVGIFDGHDLVYGLGPGFVRSYTLFVLTVIAQLVIALTLWRGTQLGRS